MGKIMRALGLMSGTSLDGIDVALVETDGGARVSRGPALTVKYDDDMRQHLLAALKTASAITDRQSRPGNLPLVERLLTFRHATAVSEFLKAHGVTGTSIDVIGFHGQTVLHRPQEQLTVQLGDGQLLSDMTRLPVVFDMRAADVAAGGQGAPLVPIYHQALMSGRRENPIAIVNIGGVANVTWIGREGRLIAFDTGPGNALIDDWIAKHTGKPYDDGGEVAALGRVHDDIVQFCLSQSYFAVAPPKSLDRNTFTLDIIEGMSLEDGAATLAAFTAGAIAKSREHMPDEPAIWIISGGGRRNKTIMRMIAERVQNAVVPAEAASIDGDALEAEAWAYMAVRALRGLPLTFPGTTGVLTPRTGGVVVSPRSSIVH